jgi:hypothetical protein
VLEKELPDLRRPNSARFSGIWGSDLLIQQLAARRILLSAAPRSSCSRLFRLRDKLLTLINKKQILTGVVYDFSATLHRAAEVEYDELVYEDGGFRGSKPYRPEDGYLSQRWKDSGEGKRETFWR